MSRVTAAPPASLEDFVPLFGELGYTPGPEPAEPPLRGPTRALLLARHGPFKVLGVEVTQPLLDTARRTAAELARHAERGLVVAFAPRSRRAAISTWRSERAPVARALDLSPPDPATLDLLDRLRPRPDEPALALHFRLAEVLGTEGVGRRFFRAFRRTLDHFTHACPLHVGRSDARVLALTTLTRVLFLYFVQAKGWLNGERDYLRRRLDGALAARRSFHRDVLEPLVFGALSMRTARPSRELGTVPFLNGGLFERTSPEERHGTPVWPNPVWRRAFEELFDRFRFSGRESGSDETVEPDMLGRVFEGMMDRDRRRSAGCYYTPHTLVLEVLDLALVPLLARRAAVSRDVARAALAGERPPDPEAARLVEAVRHMTLLDPAVGSGAFLLGALERLTALHQTLLRPHTPPPHRIRRAVLHRNLFGVDADLIAVRIAELRLWLAVVADDPAAHPESVAPLPNLDGVVRQGDSLLDPVALAVAGYGATAFDRARREATRVAEARQHLFAAAGRGKGRALRALRSAERRFGRTLLRKTIRRLEREIRGSVAEARRPTLFGTPAGLDRTARARLADLRRRRRAARTALRRLGAQGELPFFSFELHWPDVLADGGFDLIVGNPPWVRGERLGAVLRSALASRYRSFRTSGAAFGHLPDLFQAFVERALELAAPGGVVALLAPSKLTTAGYAAPTRRLLATETTVEHLWRVQDDRGGTFRAAVYPLALVVSKCAPSAPQRAAFLDGPWVTLRRPERALAQALRSVPTRVSDSWVPRLGVKTGANGIFLGHLGPEGFTSLAGAMAPLARTWLRPAVRGRDVAAFTVAPALSVVWTHDASGRPLPDLPADLREYLSPLADALARRTDAEGLPYWALFRTAAAKPVPRTVWSDLARNLTAAVLPAGSTAVPLNTCYAILLDRDEDAYALAALLNSTPLRWLARAAADEARGGYRRYNARVVGALPLPPAWAEWRALAEVGRAAHTGHHDPRTTDALVATAFGLGAAARDTLARLAGDMR